MRAHRLLLPALIVQAALHGVSFAQATKLIGINFMGRTNGDVDTLTMALSETAGVNLSGTGGPNYNQANWNNMETDFPFDGLIPNTVGSLTGTATNGGNDAANYTTNTLRDSLGASSLITLSVANANDQWNTPNGGEPGVLNDGHLFYGLYKRQNVGASINFTFNNLIDSAVDGTLYELIVYYSVNNLDNEDGSANGRKMDLLVTGSDGGAGTITMGKYVREMQVNVNAFGGYVEGTSANSASRDTFGSNYSRFTGLRAYDLDGAGAGSIYGIKIDALNQATGDGIGIAGLQLRMITPLGLAKIWTGVGGTTWDAGLTTNWSNGAAVTFANGEAAQFDDTASVKNLTVAVGGVTIGSMTVDNSIAGGAYVIGGAAIGGDGGLNKKGIGELTLTGLNTFTGPVQLQQGVTIVNSIGGGGTPGALGAGGLVTLGAIGSTATLRYTGVADETVTRSLAVAGSGGTIEVPAGVSVTLTGSFSGTGDLTKTGTGALRLTGAGTQTGSLNVAAGTLEVNALASGNGKTVTVGGAVTPGTLRYTGGNLNDARGFTQGAAGATVEITNARSNWTLAGAANLGTAQLVKTGPGRLALSGAANFSVMPMIVDGVLALTNSAGTNVLPASLSVGSGTLELGRDSFAAGTPLVLSGGTVRLANVGLQGDYYTGGFNDADWRNLVGGSIHQMRNAYVGLGTPQYSLITTTGGQNDLNFAANNGGNNSAGAPFGNQGVIDTNNIRAHFHGQIVIPATGSYNFYVGSDDGSGLFIDGTRVVNNNFNQGFTFRNGSINLTAGLHEIAMFYYEVGGDAALNVEWEGPGITRQAVPNLNLYGGSTLNASTSPVSVTASSSLEVAYQTANLGPLTQSGGTTFTVNGVANFASTTFAGVGTPTLNVSGVNSQVQLGTIGSAFTLTKTGQGSLVFSQPTVAGSALTLNEGIAVIAGSESGGVTIDPLANAAVTFNGGGLGLTATAGNPTYTANLTSATNWRIEAGQFGLGVANPVTSSIQYNPAGGTLNAVAGQTGSFRVRENNYTLGIGAAIGGAGSIVAEEGVINFQGPTFSPAGGFTVHLANSTVTAPINSGPITVTGALNGVIATPGFGVLNASNTITAPSLAVSGGTLNAAGVSTITNNVTVSGGTANFQAPVAAGGALITSGGTTNLTAEGNAFATIQHNGGTLNIQGSTTVGGGTTIAPNQTINFNAAGTVNFNSSISGNYSAVRVTSGIANLGANPISFAQFALAEGLQEGVAAVLDNNLENPGNRGIVDRPRMGETSAITNDPNTGWATANQTWVYSGQFFDADGVFAFAENIDDNVRVMVDGVMVITNDQWNVPTSSGNTTSNVSGKTDGDTFTHNYGMGPDGDGWHNVKFLFAQGGGGAGPVGENGWGGGDNATFANKGFGFNSNPTTGVATSTDGSNYVIPIENLNGTPELFRTPMGGGSVEISAGSALMAGSLVNAGQIVITGGGTLALNDAPVATSNSTFRIEVGGSGTLSTGANHRLATSILNVSTASGIVTKEGSGVLRITDRVTSQAGAVLTIQDGTMLFDNQSVTSPGNLTTTAGGAAIIGGTGKTPGSLMVSIGGTVAPGSPSVNDGLGELDVLGDLEINGGSLAIQLRTLGLDAATPDYDRINVTGTTDFTGSSLALTLASGFSAPAGSLFFIVINDQNDALIAGFDGLAEDSLVQIGGTPFRINYDANFDAGLVSGGNDIALELIPEPSTALMLLGGLGAMVGGRRTRRRA